VKTFAQALDLHDDPKAIAEYEEYHRAVWPEVKAALRAIGIVDMQIFRTGNRLFMIFSAPDDFVPARDFAKYTAVPRAREWDELMRGYQQRVRSAPDGAWWTPMDKVFDLNWE
jgi:L-rhamnose mutarotase